MDLSRLCTNTREKYHRRIFSIHKTCTNCLNIQIYHIIAYLNPFRMFSWRTPTYRIRIVLFRIKSTKEYGTEYIRDKLKI